MEEIKNEDLRREMLPDATDRNAVFKFAMSFNGYEVFGSFEQCADAAKSQRRRTLSDMRNELFFEARASRHRMDDDFLRSYEELRPLIEAELTGR